MKITFEFDKQTIEETELEATLYFNQKLKQIVATEIEKQLIAEYEKRTPDFGDLGITKEDIKQAVIEKLAQQQVDKMED